MNETENATETKTPAKNQPKPLTERQAARNFYIVAMLIGAGLMGVTIGLLLLAKGESTWLPIGMLGAMIGVFAHAVNRGIPFGFRKGFWERFAKDKTAVSPVIAVILMVAITVVLAAVVFVLVSDIGSQRAESSFQVGLRMDEVEDRMMVTTAGHGADWSLLEARVSNPVRWSLNAPATGASPPVAASTWFALAGSETTIYAGDFVDLCGQGGQEATTLEVRNTESNSVVSELSLSDVAAC